MRYDLAFGAAFTGLVAAFSVFRRSDTNEDETAPTIYEDADGWYYFDFDWRTTSASKIKYTADVAGKSLDGTIENPGAYSVPAVSASAAGICNQALIRLGVRGALIDDLNTDGTEEAEVFQQIYEDVRDACLAAFPWPFATLRSALNLIAAEQEPLRDGWLYVYALPADCLQERSIWQAGTVRNPPADSKLPFTIEKATVDDSRVLLCDTEDAILFYTARFTDPTKFPPLFKDALAWLLAAEAAPAITGKESKEDMARKRFWMKIHEAQVAALNGIREDPPPTTESIAERA